MKFTPAHMNYVLVEIWHSFQQKSACAIIDAFLKTKLLPLAPPDHDTNTQACLAATQTPSGGKSEEIEEIARASMAPVAVDAIRTTDPMVILRAQGIPSSNLLIRAAAYNTVQYRTILPIQEMKAAEESGFIILPSFSISLFGILIIFLLIIYISAALIS